MRDLGRLGFLEAGLEAEVRLPYAVLEFVYMTKKRPRVGALSP